MNEQINGKKRKINSKKIMSKKPTKNSLSSKGSYRMRKYK